MHVIGAPHLSGEKFKDRELNQTQIFVGADLCICPYHPNSGSYLIRDRELINFRDCSQNL
jgi:hypothetical protein